MPDHQPITSAVYAKQRGGKPKATTKPRRTQPAGSLVQSLLGADTVAELYRALGMRPPKERGGR